MRAQVENPLRIPLDDTSRAWLELSVDGWGLYRGPDLPESQLLVRLGLAPTMSNPPVIVTDMRLSTRAAITATLLRLLPLARIAAACNQPAYYGQIRERVRSGDEDPAPVEVVEAQAPLRLTLDVPPGRPKPDRFYAQVADTFGRLSVTSPRPAPELASANGVPVTTIHGWVAEARRRGFLPAGERSRRIR